MRQPSTPADRELRVSSPDRVIFPATERTPRDHQARGRRVLPRRRRRHHARAARPADDARALAEGRPPGHRPLHAREARRRRLLPEARPEGRARLRRDGADRVPLRPRTPTRSARPRSPSSAGARRWARSPSTRGRCAATTSTIPTSCGSTSTRSPAPTSPTPSRRGRGARAARRARLHRLPQDLGRPRHAHLRPHRAALDVHRRPPCGDRLRPGARAPLPGEVTTKWWKEERGERDLRRLQPERPRPHDRLAPTASAPSRARRSRRRSTGTSCRASRPRTSPSRRCRRASPSAATATRRSTTSRTRCSRCWTSTSATRPGDMPYPPDYPKMPGEPKRVQPSRDRDRKQ